MSLTKRVRRTYKYDCKGINKERGCVLPKAEKVILIIYEDGERLPTCRYYHDNQCCVSSSKSDRTKCYLRKI